MRPDAALAAELLGAIEALDFESLDFVEEGDPTCTLSVRRRDDTHAASWRFQDSNAPAPLRSIAERIRALVDDPAITGSPEGE